MTAAAAETPTAEIRYLRVRDVIERTTLSLKEIDRRVAAETFPQPIRLGYRTRVWVESEIAAWMARQAAARGVEASASAAAASESR
jgi:predicted DNA-binding transcriptional regulator AlpA